MDSDRRIHVKVVLLGRTHSGKSCLVKRYMEGNFEGDQLAVSLREVNPPAVSHRY